uniref:Uncharacterized protein n=1 Tax=Setaria viridis TaxID=4556 RepID=A0A4V6D9R5_SETVI|nr:hypothetical protein SEVIR_3G204900v2 [Setaria viridis]
MAYAPAHKREKTSYVGVPPLRFRVHHAPAPSASPPSVPRFADGAPISSGRASARHQHRPLRIPPSRSSRLALRSPARPPYSSSVAVRCRRRSPSSSPRLGLPAPLLHLHLTSSPTQAAAREGAPKRVADPAPAALTMTPAPVGTDTFVAGGPSLVTPICFYGMLLLAAPPRHHLLLYQRPPPLLCRRPWHRCLKDCFQPSRRLMKEALESKDIGGGAESEGGGGGFSCVVAVA